MFQMPWPFGIVQDAKCRVGITMDPEGREATYRDDWPYAGEFKVLFPMPFSREGAARNAMTHAKGCGCEYDYEPDEVTPLGEWWVYHFMQGGRGIRSLM